MIYDTLKFRENSHVFSSLPSSEEYSPLWAYSRLLYKDPGVEVYHREPGYRSNIY